MVLKLEQEVAVECAPACMLNCCSAALFPWCLLHMAHLWQEFVGAAVDADVAQASDLLCLAPRCTYTQFSSGWGGAAVPQTGLE